MKWETSALKSEKAQRMVKASTSKIENPSQSISAPQAFFIHLACGVGLAVGLCVSHNVYSINLASDPSHTLRLIWIFECPLVILLFSGFRKSPEKCSYLKASIRGLLALPVGALVNALGAIALGAPVGIKYFQKTVNWSLLMSLFTFVPAVSVFGFSWEDWRRLFANTKPNASLDYIICLPAHGAVIGAWFGAWPMPLDWERPWQEWPICVSYGAMAGYLVAMLTSLVLVIVHGRHQHPKTD